MQNNYEYMIKKVPWWLNKNKNVQAFYSSISKLFDEIDKTYLLLEKQYLIDYAYDEFLENIGIKFNVERKNQSDMRYRNRIKLKMKQINLVPNLETLYEIGQMFSGITPQIDTNINNEPAMYNIKFIGHKNYDFSLIDDLNLNNIVGGGVKINTEKCLENWEIGLRFGKKFLGQSKIKDEIKKSPICNFDYIKLGNFGNNKLGQFDFGKNNNLNIK